MKMNPFLMVRSTNLSVILHFAFIFQILSSLLGSEQVPTDDTLEAGLHFVTKIGPHLEERITKKEKASADLK